jgi:hypothetical protein
MAMRAYEGLEAGGEQQRVALEDEHAIRLELAPEAGRLEQSRA